MELPDGTREVVDPEVRAYVSSLVTAVSDFCRNHHLKPPTQKAQIEDISTV